MTLLQHRKMCTIHLISLPLWKALHLWAEGKITGCSYYLWNVNATVNVSVDENRRYLCDCEYGACTGNSLRVVLGNITFYNWKTWRIAEYCNFSELVILCNKKHQIPWRDVLCFWRFQLCFYVSAVKNITATQGWNGKDMLRLCHTSQPWDRCIKYR